MKLIQLFESSVYDVATKGFKSFLKDYSNSNNNDLFVVFSDTKYADFKASNIAPFKNAMVVFPVDYVIRNATKFANKKGKYLTVVRLEKGIDINNISTKDLVKIFNMVHYQTGAMEYQKDNQRNLINGYKERYGSGYVVYALSDILTSYPELSRKLPSYIYDNSSSASVLSNEFSSIAFIFNKYATRHVTHYYNDNKAESNSRSKHTTRKLAAVVSEALGSKLSSDKDLVLFTETIYWTLDGIEIHITKLYAPQSQKDLSDNDGTYYIIECDTPNGVVIYNTSPSETFEHIKEQIQTRFASMNRPAPSWKPKSRDLYLTGSRFTHKMFDQDKERFIDTVKTFYPRMRDYAMRFEIVLPQLEKFSDMDMIAIYHVMETFLSKQPKPLIALQRIKEEGISIDELIGINMASGNINYELIHSIALAYSAAKKVTPNRTGWHIFKYAGQV